MRGTWLILGGVAVAIAFTAKKASATPELGDGSDREPVWENTYTFWTDATPSDQGVQILEDELDPGHIRRVKAKWDGNRKHTITIRSYEKALKGFTFAMPLVAGDYAGETVTVRVTNATRVV